MTTSPVIGVPRLRADRSLLLLVDQQTRLMPAIADAERVLRNGRRLGQLARALGMPCVGTEQSADKIGPLVDELRECCASVLAKTHFDACADGLLEHLAHVAPQRTQLVVAGCEAHVCLLQTVLGLRERGAEVWVVGDACGSRDPANHEAAMRRIERAGATIVTTEMVGFEWIGHAGHPQFRMLQALVR